MKRSIIVTVIVLCLTASLGSLAAAFDGHLMVGGALHGGDQFHVHAVVGGELQLTEQFAVSAAKALDYSEIRIGARYGVGKGAFAFANLDSGSILDWSAGMFFEREFTERLGIRAMIGVYGASSNDVTFVQPDALIQVRYDLSGPHDLVGEVTYGEAILGVAYAF